MDIELSSLKASARYKLLTSLVVPRPIAWITTVNESGSINAAPFSFFNVMGNNPPIVAFGASERPDGSPKDTPRNIVRQGQFVVNLVDKQNAKMMHLTAAAYDKDVSEISALAIPTEASFSVTPPRIASSKVQLECLYHSTVVAGQNAIILGVVQHLHIEDGLIDPKTYRISPGAFHGVGRLQGPGWYCTSESQFDLGGFPKPT